MEVTVETRVWAEPCLTLPSLCCVSQRVQATSLRIPVRGAALGAGQRVQDVGAHVPPPPQLLWAASH